jgi:hypothetical protein
MNLVKRYIPEKVYEEIQKLNYKNLEHLYVICDMIYRISIFKKENKDYSNQFIDIPKYYFRDLIVDSKSLSLAFDVLKSNGIILSDNVYSKLGGKALGYRFTDEMISKLISINIEKRTISKKIISNKNDRNNLVNEKLHKYRNFFLNNFKLDYDKSIDYLNKWYKTSLSSINLSYVGGNYHQEWLKLINKYNHIFISLSAINDGELYFRRNDTNGRVDTNLTSLKSEYKQFIISKECLYQIDIINSQPFILSLYLNSSYVGGNIDEKELTRYNDWTGAGMFYELFQNTYKIDTGKTLTRKMIKDMMFCIFYSKNGSYNKEKNIFSSIFPTISKWIEKEKQNKHNEFAIRLQKIESKICIDIISQELDKEGIEYYTIHDAWLVKKEDIQKTEKTIVSNFYKYFSRRPEMKIEKIHF